MLSLPTRGSQRATQSLSQSSTQSITFLVARRGASKLAVVGPTQQEAGPFHEDPCRLKELQLRVLEWGMTAVETGELGPGNDVQGRRTWGICEICILTETAKISPLRAYPTYLRYICRCRRPRGVRLVGRQATQPAEGAFPVPVATTAHSCRLCQLCSPNRKHQEPPSAIVSPHIVAVAQHSSVPEVFLPEAARHGLAVALALPAALVPSLARLHLLHGVPGCLPTLRRSWLVSFSRCPRLD